ncbi:hypothetical protein KIN20_037275 [Parelaphostrongylus tenuis]|uniref:Uncharacterized protein n=1 Tax=Parelaphostrongylus tenuis TaxID=148309 RepID=A0AAD5REI2_PARTN|nr:hypothetical protein KIN20_037275 [Parelaphostrongylus tenuis]
MDSARLVIIICRETHRRHNFWSTLVKRRRSWSSVYSRIANRRKNEMQRAIIVLCALCVLGMSQMTFTDRWNKRDVPSYELFTSSKTSGRSSKCSRHSIEELFFQLYQIQAAEKEILNEIGVCSLQKSLR